MLNFSFNFQKIAQYFKVFFFSISFCKFLFHKSSIITYKPSVLILDIKSRFILATGSMVNPMVYVNPARGQLFTYVNPTEIQHGTHAH